MIPPTARTRVTRPAWLMAAAVAAACLVSSAGTLLIDHATTAQAVTPEVTSTPGPLASAGPSASPVPSALASSGPIASSSVAPEDIRPEGTWLVTGYDTWGEGLVAPLRGSTLTVSLLSAGRLEGETGCGTYLGGYSVDGGTIRLGIISPGSGRCRQRLDDEAFGFRQALGAVTGWAPGPTGLQLRDDEGRVRVSLERPLEVGPTGAWLVGRLAHPDGELGPILDGSEVSLVLADDGSFTGRTGCRQLEGSYTVEADRIVIAPIIVVGLPCDGQDMRPLQRQDRRLLALLDEAVAWLRLGETLTLADGAGSAILELRAWSSGYLSVASPAPVGAAATVLPPGEGGMATPSPSAG